MSRLTILDRDNWSETVNAPAAVVMLSKTDCPACSAWTAELETFLATDEPWTNVSFGKIYLDKPGLGAFKKAHPWIATLDALPHNVIFQDGEKVKDWAGGGLTRLIARHERTIGT